MVSQTQAACYTSSSSNLPPDGRQSRTAPYYNRPPYPLYYPSPPSSSSVSAVAADSRRYTHLPPFSSHDSQGNHGVGHNTSHGGHHRAVTVMADHHHGDAETPQRKRIAVACSRCRKRKIRCSGDPGDGLPCSNCKNAGVEQCRFLRVASREAPIRLDMGDPFGYPVSDARLFHAGRGGPAPPSLLGSHQQDTLPYSSTLSEVAATSYGHRSGSLPGYSYGGGATKPTSYYPMPPTTAYHSAYGEEYADYGIGVHSQSVMSPVEAVSAAAAPWPPVRAKTSTHSFSNLFTLDPETSTYTSYPTSALVHRPSAQHAVSPVSPVDGPAPFSFTNVAASLPNSSDRLLPNPTVRAATLPYPSGLGKSTSNGASSSGLGLADMASAAGNYASSYEYSSQGPESSSRSNSDGHSYGGSSSQPESMFSDETRSALSSQGPAFDSMSGSSSYTSTTGGHDSSSTRSAAAAGLGPNTRRESYVPAEKEALQPSSSDSPSVSGSSGQVDRRSSVASAGPSPSTATVGHTPSMSGPQPPSLTAFGGHGGGGGGHCEYGHHHSHAACGHGGHGQHHGTSHHTTSHHGHGATTSGAHGYDAGARHVAVSTRH